MHEPSAPRLRIRSQDDLLRLRRLLIAPIGGDELNSDILAQDYEWTDDAVKVVEVYKWICNRLNLLSSRLIAFVEQGSNGALVHFSDIPSATEAAFGIQKSLSALGTALKDATHRISGLLDWNGAESSLHSQFRRTLGPLLLAEWQLMAKFLAETNRLNAAVSCHLSLIAHNAESFCNQGDWSTANALPVHRGLRLSMRRISMQKAILEEIADALEKIDNTRSQLDC